MSSLILHISSILNLPIMTCDEFHRNNYPVKNLIVDQAFQASFCAADFASFNFQKKRF